MKHNTKQWKTWRQVRKKLLTDKELKKTYDVLEPQFAIIEKMIEKRLRQGLTQKELAAKAGTKQSAISRFESGECNPTLSFLGKLADALDAKITISVK